MGGDDGAGPNGLRHFEQSLAVASRTGLAIETIRADRRSSTTTSSVYVLREAEDPPLRTTRRRAPDRHVFAYFGTQLQTGEFPHLRPLGGRPAGGPEERGTSWPTDEGRFERGLQIGC